MRQLAPTVPDALATTIAACLARDVAARPSSFARLIDMLGPATKAGAAQVARTLRHPVPAWQGVRRTRRRQTRHSPVGQWAAGAAVGALLLGIAVSPMLVRRRTDALPVIANTERKELATASADVVADRQPRQPIEPNQTPARVDLAVKPAVAVAPVEQPEPVLDDLVLPAGEMLRVEQLDLKPHVHVRGPAGRRPLVSLSRRGLLVGCEDVCFEGIDFVWEHGPSGTASDERFDTMINSRAQTVTFRRCSFTVAGDAVPVAIRFIGSADRLPGLGGEVALFDCVFDGLAAVVDHRGAGSLSVQMDNALCVAAGPIARLSRWPAVGESFSLVLDHVTTRGDTAVVECRHGRPAAACGTITITANESVLAANGRGGLVILTGSQPPDQCVPALSWNGQGSIVTPKTAMAVWRAPGAVRKRWPKRSCKSPGWCAANWSLPARPTVRRRPRGSFAGRCRYGHPTHREPIPTAFRVPNAEFA